MPELRDYQKEDVSFLKRIRRSACFNEQRTGKTPVSLSVFKEQQLTKVLIVCPASAMYQWKDEYERWVEKPCIVLDGSKERRLSLLSQWTYGLVISYDNLKIKFKKNTDGVTSTECGDLYDVRKHSPDGIILDEAHRIKDYTSATAKAVFKMIKTPNIIALTATPAPNRAYEIWSILHLLYPEQFTSYWKFINEFFGSVQKVNYNAGKTYHQENTTFLPGKAEKLQRFLNKMSTNRKRKDVMPWLPSKDYEPVRLPATRLQKAYLESLEKYYEVNDMLVQGTLDRLIRYRQICLHPALLGLKGSSPKLDWILQYVSDYPERPIIIFSKFTSFLKILFDNLKDKSKVGLIIGETTAQERNKLIQSFQGNKLNILLLQIDTCKEAVTLDRAQSAIFTDIYPPVSDLQQAEDRFVATTPEKANKPHTVIKLILKETYDEELHTLVAQRASEVDVINNFKKYMAKGG